MAPRRLIALMLGLLLISSLLATLVPAGPQHELDTTSPQSGREMPNPKLPRGELLQRNLRIEPRRKPTIRAGAGDQLALTVTSSKPVSLELAGLGATENADPSAPAEFNVLLLQPGRYPIRVLETGRSVGYVAVEKTG